MSWARGRHDHCGIGGMVVTQDSVQLRVAFRLDLRRTAFSCPQPNYLNKGSISMREKLQKAKIYSILHTLNKVHSPRQN